MGGYNSMLYAPMTLLVGGYTDKVNRKNLILSSCFIGGFVTLANAYTTNLSVVIGLRIAMGFFSSLFQPASYSIINDYFPPAKRTKAFFIYQILGTFADIIQFQSLPLIGLVGWRKAYMICGGLGIITPIIGLTFLREPPNPIRIKAEQEAREEQDPEHKKLTADDGEKVKKRKKPSGICGLLAEYVWGFKMILTNPAAALCLLGIILRIWETAISSNLMSKYINVYQTDKNHGGNFSTEEAVRYSKLYPQLAGIAVLAGSILSNIMSGFIIGIFDEKSPMTIPYVCAFRHIMDLPSLYMIFM